MAVVIGTLENGCGRGCNTQQPKEHGKFTSACQLRSEI